ncbi:DUF2142 domain-containing protein [Phytohabitans rumicis]|uniref:DUF2142 domain-containing protein n=1 Tax=Phytohabitans rumicis TaxID=1076125 RepID=A0A6V8LDU6_9ACTN|nr:DUF2142 domain-containing protein [Phytohabitans rumicis]GFJ92266.1 hypothetical protein Prum_059080 [Phytohabitans rumicis]
MSRFWWAKRLVWVGVFLGLVLIGGAWAVATPIGGTPDEKAHIYHAAGVAGGDFFAKPTDAKYGTGVFHEIPQNLVNGCEKGGIADFCANPQDPDKLVRVGTYTGRYNPLYYAAVGVPLRLWPNAAGLLASRMISVLLVAAVLTAAIYSAARWSRSRVLIPALVVAGTPMLFHLMGAVNPNALEIAAGTLFFCALIPLADPSTTVHAACVRLAGVAGILLVTLRGLGPLWLAIGLVVVLAGAGRGRLRELARHRTVRRWGVAVLVAGAAGVAWTVLFKATAGAEVATQHVGPLDALKTMVLVYWGAILIQMVGNLGYLSTALPGFVVFTWAAVVGFLVVGVGVLGSRSAKVRVLALILACLAIPTLAVVTAVDTLDFFWQGRYSLPLAVCVPLICAHELAVAGVLTGPAIRRLTRMLVVVLLPAQLIGLLMILVRWQNNMVQVGVDLPLNPLESTGWRPALGPLLPIVLMFVGLTVVGWAYLALVRPAVAAAGESPPAEQRESPVDSSDRPEVREALAVNPA